MRADHKLSSSDVDAPSLDAILERNIQILIKRRKEEQAAVTKHQGVAIAVGRFIGSFGFIYTHLALFSQWDFCSSGAIFLTTLVLINQNRMSVAADKRAELDLQINLLTEHELTRLLHLVSAVAERLNGVFARTQACDAIFLLRFLRRLPLAGIAFSVFARARAAMTVDRDRLNPLPLSDVHARLNHPGLNHARLIPMRAAIPSSASAARDPSTIGFLRA